MRDLQNGKVILDVHRNPKELPPFNPLLVYHRLPLNAPQKIARFHIYSSNAPPPPEIDDPTTWEPFLPSDDEFDAEEVRAGWVGPSSGTSGPP